MSRLTNLLLGCGITVVFGGCAICCAPYYDDYPTYGGKVQRTNPEWGRVGSIFSDPYTAGTGPTADSNLKTFTRKAADKASLDPSEDDALEKPGDNNSKVPEPLQEPQPDENKGLLDEKDNSFDGKGGPVGQNPNAWRSTGQYR